MLSLVPDWAYLVAALLASFAVFMSAAVRAVDATAFSVDD
jgi:hypothetical protein